MKTTPSLFFTAAILLGTVVIARTRSADLVNWKKEPKSIFRSDESRIQGTRAFPDCVMRQDDTWYMYHDAAAELTVRTVSQSDTTYYVDAVAGCNDNSDIAADKAWKTIINENILRKEYVMKKAQLLDPLSILCLAVLLGILIINAGCAAGKPRQIKRVGMVVGIDPDRIPEYKRLHADDNPGVRDILSKYHMQNFSIFLQKMPDGKWYEFGYYEYTGEDFEGDMKKMDQEPRTVEWLKMCDPMQIPLPGAEGWTEMERVYFNQ